MAAPYDLTCDGYETQWQTNYLSPFFLIKSLLPMLASTAAGNTSQDLIRIVNVSSDAAFVPIAPNLDVENPNLDYIKGTMAAWYISQPFRTPRRSILDTRRCFIAPAYLLTCKALMFCGLGSVTVTPNSQLSS